MLKFWGKAKNYFIVFVGLLGGKAALLISHFVITRNSGPDVYGVFSIAILLVNFFALLSMLGLNQALIRFGVRYIYDNKVTSNYVGFFNGLLKTTLISSVVFGGGAVLLVLFLGESLISWQRGQCAILVMMLAIPMTVRLTMEAYFFRPMEVNWPEVYLRNLARGLLFLTFLSILVFSGTLNDPVYISIAFLLSLLLPTFIIVGVRKFTERKASIERVQTAVSQSALRYGVYSILGIVFYEALTSIDRFFLNHYSGLESVGRYSAASMMARQTELFALVILTVLAPKMSIQTNSIRRDAWILSLILFGFGVGALVIMNPYLYLILDLMGEGYGDYDKEFFVLLCGFLCVISATPVGAAIQYSKLISTDVTVMLVCLIMNGALCWMFVGKYQTIGAAYSTALSLASLALLRFVIYGREHLSGRL